MSWGGLLALVVFLVALLTALGVLNAGHLLFWLIAALALAVLLGGFTLPAFWRRGPTRP